MRLVVPALVLAALVFTSAFVSTAAHAAVKFGPGRKANKVRVSGVRVKLYAGWVGGRWVNFGVRPPRPATRKRAGKPVVFSDVRREPTPAPLVQQQPQQPPQAVTTVFLPALSPFAMTILVGNFAPVPVVVVPVAALKPLP